MHPLFFSSTSSLFFMCGWNKKKLVHVLLFWQWTNIGGFSCMVKSIKPIEQPAIHIPYASNSMGWINLIQSAGLCLQPINKRIPIICQLPVQCCCAHQTLFLHPRTKGEVQSGLTRLCAFVWWLFY